jgi:tetraacyldisaccharide 4'-kinase
VCDPTKWAESYLYRPSFFQRFISYLLSPLSLIYCLAGRIRRALTRARDLGVPVISVGNLTVGGSGKTPVGIAIAHTFRRPAIVLRGYKRASKGLIIVSMRGEILCDVATSGDEAMLYARELPHAIIIASEDRVRGIIKAKELGAEVVILDDGFGKANIAKYEILIRPTPPPASSLCLPSGAYRESVSNYARADMVLEQDVNFKREVSIEEPQERMVLISAIANPARLEAYLPDGVVARYTFPDHHAYKRDELTRIMEASGAQSILTTGKDLVKIEEFGLRCSLMRLTVTLADEVVAELHKYVANYRKQGA